MTPGPGQSSRVHAAAGESALSNAENTSSGTTLAEEIEQLSGIDVLTCYQCGKCSAGCPMNSEMRHKPHDIMRLAQRDRREELLDDESLWLCLTCETCSARCPNSCDPARVIDTLREMAAAAGRGPQQRSIRAFHHAFLEQVRRNGRIYEVGFMMSYKIRSGALVQDVANAPGMMTRGKLPVLPERIDDLEDVRQIFRACEGEGS